MYMFLGGDLLEGNYINYYPKSSSKSIKLQIVQLNYKLYNIILQYIVCTILLMRENSLNYF